MTRPDFAARRAARVERLEERADKLRAEGETKLGAAHALADRIPMGQPILVGHHSEHRARRDQERIHANMAKGVELLDAAKETARRAEAAASNTAIDSDDPEALVKLREKLAGLEERQAKLNDYRRCLRKGGGGELALLALGVPQLTADEMMRNGIPDYVGSNLSANIRSVKKRIAELEKAATKPTPADERYGEIVVSESLNRVQIRFPGKPDEATRGELKSHGFRWAPSEGAWQRKASNQAWYWAREIARTLG
jgi:hypothetical protein